MTKKLLLIITLFFSLSLLKAQEKLGSITITHGKEIGEDSEKIVKIAGETNNKIYTLATKGKKYFVKIFESSGMALLSTNEIEFPELNDKDVDFEEIMVVNGRIYILGSVYDNKENEANLVGVEISESGKLTDNKVILFSTKVTKKSERGVFYFKESPTRDKLLILHASLFDKEEMIQYEIKLVDDNLDVITSHLEKVPFTDRRGLEFTISDFDVNIHDDVFLVINESYRDKKAKENIEKFQVHTFKSSNDFNKEIIDINFKDKEVVNCEILATQDEKLHLVGFYSSVRENGKANKDLKGVYASVVDVRTNTVENLKFSEFNYATKVLLLGKKRAENGKDVRPLYLTHSLIEKNDGGLILLSEYQQVVIGQTSGIGPLGLTPITVINNEIIVTSLSVDGSVEWTNVVAKKQRASYTELSLGFYGFSGNSNFSVSAGISIPIGVLGKGPEYLSAMPIYEDGQLMVVFNDNQKNIGITDIEEVKGLGNYNKALPTIFVFDNTGNISRIDQEEYQKDQLVLRPRVYYRKSPNEYIIYSSRKSQDKLGRMVLGK